MTNAETIQDIYQAFGTGDIPRILGYLSPSVEWEYGKISTDVPWLQPRRGSADVAHFFAALQALEFHSFVPKHVLSSGNIVVSLVDVDVTVKATGRRFLEEDEVHIWHFDSAGKIVRFRHRADTYLQQLAYRPA